MSAVFYFNAIFDPSQATTSSYVKWIPVKEIQVNIYTYLYFLHDRPFRQEKPQEILVFFGFTCPSQAEFISWAI